MFKKGIYQFNREPNFNFQLNRVVMWGNGDPEEVLSVSEGITDSRSWVDALTSLARKAEEEGRTEAQIGYLRMSEFFMYDRDPEKVETYRKAKSLFYEYYADELMEHAVERTDVPYKKGTVPVMHCRAKGECRGGSFFTAEMTAI